MEIKGELTSMGWYYWCKVCKRRFTEQSPTISAPAICEACYNGCRSPRGKEDFNDNKRTSARYKKCLLKLKVMK